MPFSPKLARFQGEWAEACFIAKAMSKGLRVSKPFGDSVPYDFITEFEGRLRRVQVKSIARRFNDHYHVNAVRHSYNRDRIYTRRDIDAFVVFIIPEDLWYIIPIRAVASSPAIYFYPHRTDYSGRFETFREAWRHLQ